MPSFPTYPAFEGAKYVMVSCTGNNTVFTVFVPGMDAGIRLEFARAFRVSYAGEHKGDMSLDVVRRKLKWAVDNGSLFCVAPKPGEAGFFGPPCPMPETLKQLFHRMGILPAANAAA